MSTYIKIAVIWVLKHHSEKGDQYVTHYWPLLPYGGMAEANQKVFGSHTMHLCSG